MKKHFKRDIKFWLNVITFTALAFLIVISWEQIIEALGKLRSLDTTALFLMVPMQLISYYAVAKLYKIFFDSQGERISLWNMYKIALELNFVNHVFPSGGVSGFSYLSLRLRQFGVPTAKSTLAQLLRFGLTFVSFLVLLLVGVVVLAFGRNTSPLIILITTSIIFATIGGSIAGVFIISQSARIKSFVSWLPKAVNAFARRVHVRRSQELINMKKVETTLEDLHDSYVVLRKDMALIKRLLGWALLVNIAEVMTIYTVYIAFGSLINPGALIIAYAVANFAGLIAILPGGIGVYEGLMTAVLASASVPKALALSATVIYRVLSLLIFLPPGYILYQRALKSGGPPLEAVQVEQEDDVTRSDA